MKVIPIVRALSLVLLGSEAVKGKQYIVMLQVNRGDIVKLDRRRPEMRDVGVSEARSGLCRGAVWTLRP
jgi:hypothetical protein